MSKLTACSVCQQPLQEYWKVCMHCGATIDETINDEITSIDYILKELDTWPTWLGITQHTKLNINQFYRNRRAALVTSLTASRDNAIVAPESHISVTEDPAPVTPNQVSVVPAPAGLFRSATPPQLIGAATSASKLTEIVLEPTLRWDAQPEPEIHQQPIEQKPKRSLPELVAGNIKLIFAISAALFVGGIVLYYRNEIYHGLKQPVIQAILLALATLGSVIGGWTLVRRTSQGLAGRTITLVGSLLVPVNPWFLVQSGLIPQTGNGWALGLACVGLYVWTAYFLRDRLYVYLALGTGLITAWSVVYKFAGGTPTSAYVIVLMVCSIIYLLAERAFSVESEFSREVYGRPFFHVAQVGIALCLLFYTPLVKLLPIQLFAAKYYFDPHGYDSLMIVGLAAIGSLAYLYSGLSRRSNYFIYLSIAAFLWAEGALLFHLGFGAFTAVLLLLAASGFMMNCAAAFGDYDDFLAGPLGRAASLLGWLICVTAGFGLLHAIPTGLDRDPFMTSWRLLFAIMFTSSSFAVRHFRKGLRPEFFAATYMALILGLMLMVKLGLPATFVSLAFLGLACVILNLTPIPEQQDHRTTDLNIVARSVVAILLAVACGNHIPGVPVSIMLIADKVAGALFAFGVAIALFGSARRTTDEDFETAQDYGSLLFAGLAYLIILQKSGLAPYQQMVGAMLLPIALLIVSGKLRKIAQEPAREVFEPREGSGGGIVSEPRAGAIWANAYYIVRILENCALFGTATCVMVFATITPTSSHRLAVATLMVQFAGVIAALSARAVNRLTKVAGYGISGVFLTLSYTYFLSWSGLFRTRAEYALPAFAAWALILLIISRIDRLNQECRQAASFLSTLYSAPLLLICFVGTLAPMIGQPEETSFTLGIVSALFLICIKEFLHIQSGNKYLHSTLTSLTAIALLVAAVKIVQPGFDITVLAFMIMGSVYGIGAHILRLRQARKGIAGTLEVIANLTLVAAIWVFFAHRMLVGGFGIVAICTLLVAGLTYVCMARLTRSTFCCRIYSHLAAALGLAMVMSLLVHIGISGMTSLPPVMALFLSAYIIAGMPLANTRYANAIFNVAQVAMPVVLFVEATSASAGSYLAMAGFAAEVATFYFISALLRRKSYFLYPATILLTIALSLCLFHSGLRVSLYMPVFALWGLALVIAGKVRHSKSDLIATPLSLCGHALLVLSGAGVVLQSVAAMQLFAPTLDPLIVSSLVITGTWIVASWLVSDEEAVRGYRYGILALGSFAYLTIGIRLGYHLLRHAEFYTIPLSVVLIIIGVVAAHRHERSGDASGQDEGALTVSFVSLWLGSVSLAVPLTLHSLEYRFMIGQPSTKYDLGLLVASIGLLLTGVLMRLKAPTIIGGASFLIGMIVIVFSYVEWQQKWLSLSMIALAVFLFTSSWLIYFLYKRDQLGAIGQQGKHVMEEFGRWR